MQTLDAIRNELDLINRIRSSDEEDVLTDWNRGQLAGAQQALAWVEGTGMIPTEAILPKKIRAVLGIKD